MRMKGYIFLVVSLAISTASAKKRHKSKNEPLIVEIGEDKDITEANKDLSEDDILEPQETLRSTINNEDILWTSPVPYVLENDLEMNAKGVILRAFDQFRLKSCIDFKPWDSEKYYISVQKLGGCFSFIGKIQRDGQTLSIGQYCDGISTVEHEFLHALGFYHEQSRPDRDEHVTIVFENIIEGRERNFQTKEDSNTQRLPYDYWSVMHYGENAFSNGNGSTIITKDPQFQSVIGQRMEMSPSDVLGLNLLYKCNSTIAFKMYCGFSNDTTCKMNHCSEGNIGWEMVKNAAVGPWSDHTSLTSGDGTGYFMHGSTISGLEGDSAWLETRRMTPTRDCHIQCLQFYYYHSGSQSDILNIWIREFEDGWDLTGKLRFVGQITGQQTSHWQLHHVSLNTTKHFQVEFEVRKGAEKSNGGFSIDDINLAEIECPHVTMQLDDFEELLSTTDSGTSIYSPRQYSVGGYAYRIAIVLHKTHVGVFMQLLSGKYDDQLEWPCPHRQVTFQILDQSPNIQQQMSKQISITSNPSLTDINGNFIWDDPRKSGTTFVDANNETIFVGTSVGRHYFVGLEDMRSRDFLKGGSAIFVFSFTDLTPVVNGSALPCPQVGPVRVANPPEDLNRGPCLSRTLSTATPIITTTTTFTTDPPSTTDDNSIFAFVPGMVSSPVLTLLAALVLLIR